MEGKNKPLKNIDFLNKNTTIYHTRAERSAYLTFVVNKNFASCSTTAQAIFEFITGDALSTNFSNPDASEAAKYALNSPKHRHHCGHEEVKRPPEERYI